MELSGRPAVQPRNVLNFASFSHFQTGSRAWLLVALAVL
jgi:hypothetical protein